MQKSTKESKVANSGGIYTVLRAVGNIIIVVIIIFAMGISAKYLFEKVTYQKRMLAYEESIINEYEQKFSDLRVNLLEDEMARESERIKKKKESFRKSLTSAILKLQPKLDKITAERISIEVIRESKAVKLDPLLVAGLIWVESGFDPMAHSNKGAVGLMQIRYSIWKKTSTLIDNGVSAKDKLYWIDLNIKCGTEILSEYYEEANQDVAEALYRYNTGSKTIPSGVNRYEILYVNRVIRATYFISECIRNGELSAK